MLSPPSRAGASCSVLTHTKHSGWLAAVACAPATWLSALRTFQSATLAPGTARRELALNKGAGGKEQRRPSYAVFLVTLITSWLVWLPPASLEAAPLPTVAIVATGGTIAMKKDPNTGAPVPALSGDDLVGAVPELKDLACETHFPAASNTI